MSTYTPIASQTLTSTVAQVTFANIPQGYTDLVLQMNTQYSAASGAGLFFNTTGYDSLYSQTSLLGYSSAAQSGRASNTIQLTNNLVFGDSTTANIYTPSIIEIPSYSNPNVYKSIAWRYGTVIASGSDGEAGGLLGTWRKKDAINSINIFAFNVNFNNAVFAIGSSFTLYGIAASGNIGSKATGGIVTTSGSYTYHAFKESGMFTATQTLTADILVVAGGGAGGACIGGNYESGGGGGAGGVFGFASQALTAGAYTCLVGAGGAGINIYRGNSGFNSQFGSLRTIIGGGGGAGSGVTVSQSVAIAGGSGGGGSGYGNTTGAAGISGQGFAGGNGTPNTAQGAGGGGGAGAVGSNAAGETGGAGGSAVNTYTNATWLSTGLSATGLGSGGYIAGGGGGGADAGYTPGAGGGGGAGAGKTDGSGAGNNATANTGSGGGGQGGGSNGGNGGSGFIIVRYLT
jgi:hypothetical protein